MPSFTWIFKLKFELNEEIIAQGTQCACHAFQKFSFSGNPILLVTKYAKFKEKQYPRDPINAIYE